MAVKIRLARHGRKGFAYYHVVVADSRAPRDGRFIEKIGSYNPNTNPATIEVNSDRALYWLGCGAQPTDTCRSLLSKKGVLLKKHLLEGVKKGAFDEAKAEEKFQAWVAAKAKVEAEKSAKAASAKEEAKKAKLAAEIKVNEEEARLLENVEYYYKNFFESDENRAEALAKKKAEAEAAKAAEEAAKAAAETPAEEAAPATEEAAAE